MTILLTSTIWSQAQQINPVPDYVFRNQMSVGRNAVTDTAAYFSIGPRYGATKGFMPPIVGDTATFSSGKRNGLLIFSVQKNKFLYWDSVRVQWSDMAGSSGAYIVAGDTASMLAPYLRKVDTTSMLTAYLRKGDTASMLSPYYRSATASAALALKLNISDTATMLSPYYRTATATSALATKLNISDTATMLSPYYRSATATAALATKLNISDTSTMLTPYVRHAGYGLTKSGQSLLVDTLNIATRAWRQKGLDSLAALEVSGSGTTNYVPKFTAASTIGNSQIFDNGNIVGINTTSDAGYKLDVNGTLRSVNGANFATTSGNVGVGTTTPQNDAGYKAVTINGTTGGQIGFYAGGIQQTNMYGDATGLTFVTTTATPMSFLTNSLTRMTIESGGDVGIGVVNATEKLHVAGRIRVTTVDSTSTAMNMLYADATGVIKKSSVPLGTVTSDGSTNFIPKFSSSTGLSNSSIHDSVNVSINTRRKDGILHILSDSNQNNNLSLTRFNQSTHLIMSNYKGSTNFPTAIITNDEIGKWSTWGYTGTNLRLGGVINFKATQNWGANASGTELAFYVTANNDTTLSNAMLLSNDKNLIIGDFNDVGDYMLQVKGAIYNTTTITSGAPTGGSSKPWRFGEVATVSPTSPNRTIRVEIDGTVYYLHAKTTND